MISLSKKYLFQTANNKIICMALEDTDIKDPATDLSIRISTTVRILYRKAYPNEYGTMRNARLNYVIAKEFISNSNKVIHYFRLGKKKSPQNEFKPPGSEEGKVYTGVGEIRGAGSFYFVSARKSDTIDILTIQASWLKPKYRGSAEKPIEVGDT